MVHYDESNISVNSDELISVTIDYSDKQVTITINVERDELASKQRDQLEATI